VKDCGAGWDQGSRMAVAGSLHSADGRAAAGQSQHRPAPAAPAAADATEEQRRAEAGTVSHSVRASTIRGAMRLQRKVSFPGSGQMHALGSMCPLSRTYAHACAHAPTRAHTRTRPYNPHMHIHTRTPLHASAHTSPPRAGAGWLQGPFSGRAEHAGALGRERVRGFIESSAS